MKIYEWIKNFIELEEKYNKRIFTVTELANISGVKLNYARNETNRLLNKKIIQRIYWGLYSYKIPDITELVFQIDREAYLTADTILYENNMILQKPGMHVCFTLKHHGRTNVKHTMMGDIFFHKVSKKIYKHPGYNNKVPLTQAINDYLYISKKNGIDPYAKYKFTNIHFYENKK